MQKPTQSFVSVSLDTLVTDPENARLHPDANLDAITGSLELFGQVEPLVVQQGTHRVIGGNGRLAAMRAMGWSEASVVYVDCTDAEATALGLALNRTAETAAWDTDTLAALLERCREDAIDVASFGFDVDAMDKIIASTTRQAAPDITWDETSAQTETLSETSKGDGKRIETLTFKLSVDQSQTVISVLAKMKDLGPFVDDINENSDGNALARLAEMYRE